MSALKKLANRRRHVLHKIDDAERQLDYSAAELERVRAEALPMIHRLNVAEDQFDALRDQVEALRSERDRLASAIRDFVMAMPIADACFHLAEDVLDAEVIYEQSA